MEGTMISRTISSLFILSSVFSSPILAKDYAQENDFQNRGKISRHLRQVQVPGMVRYALEPMYIITIELDKDAKTYATEIYKRDFLYIYPSNSKGIKIGDTIVRRPKDPRNGLHRLQQLDKL